MSNIGLLLAAPASGSGKTTITCALLAALKKRDIAVRSFKSGPDYIDPMYHERVIGVPSGNLDTFFSDEKNIRELYELDMEHYKFSVIEGAMGLYDGLGGTRPEGSAYHLARTLDIPIFIILDSRGMGRTMLALLAGLLEFDGDHRIAGVILNRTTERFYEVIKPQIETELGLPVLGFFPEQKEIHLESRHLGLKLPGEIKALRERVYAAAEVLEKTVDVDRLLDLAERRALVAEFQGEIVRKGATSREDDVKENPGYDRKTGKKIRIAVAKDRAFCFYYKENLRLLQKMGAELVEFSPLTDTALPEQVNGILLGGGYPELFARQLSENVSMRQSIRKAIESGMPSVAECGGFMYLHETLTDGEGNSYPMVGIVPGECHNTGKLVRFGYVEIKEKESRFLEGQPIRGHEFHYYDSDCNGNSCVAVKPAIGRSWECVHEGENHWWGYPHLYYPSNPEFAANFVLTCSNYHEMQPSYRFFENHACQYFPCHKGASEFNCLFCYCPLYGMEHCPGAPKYKEKNGRQIKVCSNCNFPHKPENYDKIVELLRTTR